MRRRHHEVADGVELAQLQFERRFALEVGDRLQLMLRSGMCGGSGDDDDGGQKNVSHDRSQKRGRD
jgi:hypothetical protein